MRHMWIVSLALPLALWGCKDRTPGGQAAGQPYVVRPVQESLSPEDIRAAFHALGLQVERFDCFLPKDGKLRVFVRRYVDGQLAATPGESTVSIGAGDQHFLLFTHKQDSSLTFTFARGGGTVSWGQIDVGGYGASTSHALSPVTLEPGKEVALYMYAASKGDLASAPPMPVEQLVTQYPLTIVVFAEWQPNQGP